MTSLSLLIMFSIILAEVTVSIKRKHDIPDDAPAEDHPMECKFGFPQPEQLFTDILEDTKHG